MESEFDDIRPYNDQELIRVLSSIHRNRYLLVAFRTLVWKYCPPILAPLVDIFSRMLIHYSVKGIRTVDEFQRDIIVNRLLHWVVRKTTNGLTSSGLEGLDKDNPYLFISNHRDIVLDPALLNYVLVRSGFDIAQIAFGDNLMINDLVTDLIRVNRSFIVRRNLPLRQQLRESYKLSRYISHTIEQGESVWIAQRQGRAKDGHDITNSAIIKMLYLAFREKKITFEEFSQKYKIVPVAISYELDPLDRMKAYEINRRKTRGEYEKGKYEDLVSMYAGITKHKGRVHLTFCEPLKGPFENEKEIAIAIDREIHRNYKLWPTNYIAYDTMYNTEKYREHYTSENTESFSARYRRLSKQVREIVLEMYSNAVKNMEGQEP